jgi:hypothetical protein
MKLRLTPASGRRAEVMMISGEVWFVAVKFAAWSAVRLYGPAITRSAAAIASVHFAAPFCRPAAVTVPVNTSAFTYMLASSASTHPFVARP